MKRRSLIKGAASLAVASTLPPFPRLWSADKVPLSAFGPKSTAEDVTAGLDLSGKTAVVTGCNSGIGFEQLTRVYLPT